MQRTKANFIEAPTFGITQASLTIALTETVLSGLHALRIVKLNVPDG
jgi:hypothetical protein